MFFANLLVVTSLLYICEAGFVDSLPKCSIKDNDCMKGLFQKMLKDGEKGIPELNIPSFDTVSFKGVSINIVDAVNLTITDGEAKGISKCVFKKYSIDIEKHRGNVEAICDVVTAKAHFIVAGDSPIIQSIIGSNEAYGNGQFAVKIEKIHAFVDYHIYPQKKNGEIYLKVSDKDIKYNYDVGNAHLKAKNIMIGGTDMMDSLTKCSITDNGCMKGLFQKILKDGEKGIPEFNIPSFDPLHFKDISLNILEAVNLTITNGVAKGISKCVFKKYSIDIEKHRGSVGATCDVLTAKAHFNVAGDSPIIQSIIGSNDVNGNGKAVLKVEKINAIVDYQIYPQKKNGEIYLHVSNKNIKYSYDVGNAHLDAENIMIGGIDLSEVVSSYFNADFRQVLKLFGPNFIKKFLEILVSIIQKACDSVPANKFITEDLTLYL